MKRADLLRHLRKNGCTLLREGSRHTIYFNVDTGRVSSVPRHSEINNFLAKKICRDLGVTEIKKK